jgi:hypothetical protein
MQEIFVQPTDQTPFPMEEESLYVVSKPLVDKGKYEFSVISSYYSTTY